MTEEARNSPATASERQGSDKLAAGSMPDKPLFRPEAVAEQQTQWLGTVLLAPRLSYRLFTAFAICTIGASLSLLFLGQFTRKAQIKGWLVPEQGLIRVFAPQAGVITQLPVREGLQVRKGMPLAILSTELESAARGSTQAEIVRQLLARRDSQRAEMTLQDDLENQQTQALSGRMKALQSEDAKLEQAIKLQHQRLDLAVQTLARLDPLRSRGYISLLHVQEHEEHRLDQAVKLQDLERTRSATQRERIAVAGELRELPLKMQARRGEIERNLAELEQALAEAEARRQLVISAPQDGTVTAIQIEPGGSAPVAAPLLSIVPSGSGLEARLLSPSRAMGFLHAGQRVLIRYEAFPYQKFGQHAGVVDQVSRSAVSPGELPQNLAGLTRLYGANEPVYRISVRLAKQSVTAYGQPVPLQAGMQLEADVVIETRRIVDWILDPVYTLTGTWQP